MSDTPVSIKGELPLKEAYNDLLHPAAQQVGTALGGLVKVALTPVGALIWGYDRIRDVLPAYIEEKLKERKVSEKDIISPDPAVFVPTVQALTYSANKAELRELYINLLTASMISETSNYAHPAYAEIIKQLVPDEAKILSYLARCKTPHPIISIRQSNAKELVLQKWFTDLPVIEQNDIQNIHSRILSGEIRSNSFATGRKIIFIKDG